MKRNLKKLTLGILFIILLVSIITIETQAFSPSSTVIYNGIDVSIWQGEINFNEVINDGIKVVYIRASEGESYIDSNFESNYQKAKENGLYIGCYHYLTARTEEEAKLQAKFFVSVIGGKQIDCKLAMDFESFGDLSIEEINSIALTFLNTVKNLSGKDVIVYSDTYNAKNIFSGEITNYPLWVAEYGVEEPTSNVSWENWVGFQYTDLGEVAGIEGYVDKNKFTQDVLLGDKTEIPMIDKPDKNKETNTTITVVRGDTLSKIAQKYQTTVQKLVELNNIQNPNFIYVGQKLIVPTQNTTSTSNNEIYYVKAGDTLSKIAKNYGTTVYAIAYTNGIKNINYIYIGQKLIIPVDHYDTNHVLYTIKRGDTLYSIARKYNTTIANLVMLNRIQNPNLIYVGRVIRI